MATGRQGWPGGASQPPGSHHIDGPEFIQVALFAIGKQQRGAMQNSSTVDQGVDLSPLVNGGLHPGLSTRGFPGVVGMMGNSVDIKFSSPE